MERIFTHRVSGVIIAAVGFLLFLFLVPRPSDINLPEATSSNRSDDVPATETDPLMDDKDDDDDDMNDNEEVVIMHTEERAIGFLGALKIPGVFEFSFCLFFAKLVSYTFLYWLPNYIHSQGVDAQVGDERDIFFLNLSSILVFNSFLYIIASKNQNTHKTFYLLLFICFY